MNEGVDIVIGYSDEDEPAPAPTGELPKAMLDSSKITKAYRRLTTSSSWAAT